MPVTLLDGIVLAVVIVSAVLAMVRGFVREVLSVASWVAAAAAAYLLYKPLVPLVKPYISSDTIAMIAAAAIIFFIALIIATYITMKISDFVIDSRVGVVDRALGLVFGAVRGVLIMAVAFLFYTWLNQNPPEWVAQAETRPLLQNVGERLRDVLPKDIEAQLLNKIRGGGSTTAPTDEGATSAETAPVAPAAPAAANRGNSATERKALDNLIQNSSGAKR